MFPAIIRRLLHTMESDNLYRVQEEDLPRLQKLLTVCYAQDTLYHTLIPDDDTRERLLPEPFPAIWRSSFRHAKFILTAANWTVSWLFLTKANLTIFCTTVSQRPELHLPLTDGWSKKIQAWKPSGISFRARTTWTQAGQISFTRQSVSMWSTLQ